MPSEDLPTELAGRLRLLSRLGWALFLLMSLDALLIVGSGLLEPYALVPNVVLGLALFFLPGLFWFRKTLLLRDLLLQLPPSEAIRSLGRRLLNRELALLVFGLVVMLVGLSGIMSRVFHEGLPVFG